MNVYIQRDIINGRIVYVPVNNERFMKNISSLLEGAIKKTFYNLYKEKSCCSAYIAWFDDLANYDKAIIITIQDGNQKLFADDLVIVAKDFDPNIIWDDIMIIIDKLATETDRIGSVVQ